MFYHYATAAEEKADFLIHLLVPILYELDLVLAQQTPGKQCSSTTTTTTTLQPVQVSTTKHLTTYETFTFQ